jgi:FkbM family methyltransferase
LRLTDPDDSVAAVLEAVGPWLSRLKSARGRLHLAFLARAKLLPHLNLTIGTRVGGRAFRVPVKEGIRLDGGNLEPWLDELIRRLMTARPGSFVDVGVNLGQTLLKVKAVAPDARYFGFEPNPRCYCYVSDLVTLNSLPACKVYPFALGEKPGVVQLYRSSAADQAASVVGGFRPDDHYAFRQFATVFPGDAVLGDPGEREISTIKIDVEGAERDVLKGLTATIDRHRPFIICEVLPVYDEATTNGEFRLARQREIEAFLRERRYSIQRIGPGAAPTRIDEFGIHGDMSACNYLFAPLERAV